MAVETDDDRGRLKSRASQRLPGLLPDVALLLGLLLGLGLRQIPAHWTSIWMDREFTGWVVPISNQLASAGRLYEDGLHTPMPPLPFVFLALISQGNGTWILESGVNFLFQSATILVAFFLLSRFLPRPYPMLTCVGTVPIFLQLQKTIVYDSMAQFFAMLTGWFAYRYLSRNRDDEPVGPVATSQRYGINIGLGLLALTSVLTVFCKQSTGAGLFVGVCGTLISAPRLMQRFSPFRAATAVAAYAMTCAVCFALLCLALYPAMSPIGFMNDVFVHGSEPKGGPAKLIANLLAYGRQIVDMFVPAAVVCLLSFGLLEAGRYLRSGQSEDSDEIAKPAGPTPRSVILATILFAAVTAIAYGLSGLPETARFLQRIGSRVPAELYLLNNALFIAVLCTALCLVMPALARRASFYGIAFATSIFFPTAVFHSLSVSNFRWTYDNNPLIVVAIGTAFFAIGSACRRLPPDWSAGRRRAITCFFFAAASLVLWGKFGSQLAAIRSSTIAWPEVAHLSGARLTPGAAGMRELVRIIRDAAPSETDEVLLLPADPNVEAWLGRPKPHLSSAIIFVDQYWERYVAADMERLRDSPPKVIVIGPRNYWRGFCASWSTQSGAEQLIDRVQKELIPARYEAAASCPISFPLTEGGTDYMDVYVRRD